MNYKTSIYLLVFSIFVLDSNAISAPIDEIGVTGGTYLKIVPDARAAALGEAFSALADDVSAVYWNPAAMVQTKFGVSVMYNRWLQDISHSSLAYTQSFPVIGSLGVSVNLLQVPGIESRITPSDEPDDKFDASYLVTTIAYARSITPHFSLGVAAKYLQEQVGLGKVYANYKANGFAADIGLLVRGIYRNVNVSLVGQNLGATVSKDKLPQNVKLGLGLFMDQQKTFMILTDLNYPMDNNWNMHIGAEYVLARIVALRVGYKNDFVSSSSGGLTGLTAGFGLIFGPVMFDFAWVPYSSLGDNYRATMSFQFKS